MITDDQITALAREYAEDDNPITAHRTPTERDWDIQIDADSAERVIRFLLRRFCLVEKSKVERAMQLHEDKIKELFKGSKTWFFHKGSAETLKYLFPELGKEVEG